MSYICNTCNKSFKSKYNYNRHINNENIHNKIHNTEKYKYKCDCGKQYLHYSNLYIHKKQCNQIKTKTEPDLNQNIDYIDTDKVLLHQFDSNVDTTIQIPKNMLQMEYLIYYYSQQAKYICF